MVEKGSMFRDSAPEGFDSDLSLVRWPLVLSGVWVAAVFVADLHTPLGFAHGMLYLPAVMLVVFSRRERWVWVVAVLSALLTLLGAWLAPAPPAGIAYEVVWSNRAMALGLLALVAGLGHGLLLSFRHWRVARERDAAAAREVEDRAREALEQSQAQQRALAEQVQRTQRLESLGQLTGGVAHDFNNLLTIMLGNAEVLRDSVHTEAGARQHAEMILQAGQRGAELTRRLLAFARKQPLEPVIIDIDRLLNELDALLRRTLGEQIDIEVIRGDRVWLTRVDPAQLENAVLNLAINARDAMPEGGRLTVETANVWLDETYAELHPEVVAGPYVLLAVSDTGHGIATEALPHVFEPFFTTKEKGKGTGLGLAMVYGFVRQSGGHVSIYSEVGRGTAVKLFFPRFRGASAAETAQADQEPDARGHGETVLAVEDDPMVRRFTVQQLEALGYRVVAAADAHEALALLRTEAHVDLLFTDVVMPGGMNGRQLADAARQLRPQLPVLYTSGYTDNAMVHQGQLEPDVQLLSKPWRRAELARKIRLALMPQTSLPSGPPSTETSSS